MTVDMQDTSMILGLTLEGLPISGIIQSVGWRDMVELHIGVRPPDAKEGDASKKTSGVNTVWLRQHFNVCPQGAAAALVESVGVLYLATSIGGTRQRVDSGDRHTWNSKVCAGTQDLYWFR
jgi:hypothetical protein